MPQTRTTVVFRELIRSDDVLAIGGTVGFGTGSFQPGVDDDRSIDLKRLIGVFSIEHQAASKATNASFARLTQYGITPGRNNTVGRHGWRSVFRSLLVAVCMHQRASGDGHHDGQHPQGRNHATGRRSRSAGRPTETHRIGAQDLSVWNVVRHASGITRVRTEWDHMFESG
ncbi:MAG: hypothetical protein ABGZ17_24345 [Planctomycetaceae bacterium]